MSNPKVLFYDIETAPLKFWGWGCGKQVVRHAQLVEGHSRYGIICITYCWDKGPAHAIDWGSRQNSAKVVKEFDKILEEADIVIGKNSDRFDNKHLNTIRMWHDLEPMADLQEKCDDLEKHMRRHFYLPSNALDYISNELGLGGKDKMCFQDWIDIVEKNGNAEKSLRKMVKYGKKDVTDTRAVWNYCKKHFKPRFNHAAYSGDHRCVFCGSENIHKNGTRTIGKTRYQRYYCNGHGGIAGKAPINNKGEPGRIGA